MRRASADLIVVGGGVMGLATAWWASQSRHVVLVERFAHGHARGASHGGERIFRYAYTDPVYVRLALAADDLWQRLERDGDRTLIDRIGCVDVRNDAELAVMHRTLASEGVAVEWCTTVEAAARWPGLRFSGSVLYQPRAGRTRAAEALTAFRDEAERRGADLRFEERALRIADDGRTVTVTTEAGAVQAPVAVVTAGAWTADLIGGTVSLPPLTTTREQVAFFCPRSTDRWPSFIDRSPTVWYGVPAPNGTIKVGEHHAGPVTTADERTFDLDDAALERLRAYVREWLPGLDPDPLEATTCLYTLTPTEDFVLDRVGNIVVGVGFSGHGFKFAPAIGRTLAEMAFGSAPPGPPFAIDGRPARPDLGEWGHR